MYRILKVGKLYCMKMKITKVNYERRSTNAVDLISQHFTRQVLGEQNTTDFSKLTAWPETL